MSTYPIGWLNLNIYENRDRNMDVDDVPSGTETWIY